MKIHGISMRMTLLPLIIVSLGQSGSDPEWKVVSADSKDPAILERKSKAIRARDSLFETLTKRLTEVAESRGPAAAIAVCQDEAPKIAKQVGDRQGVKIGRTASKLRNQANRAPQWADSWIAKSPAEPVFVQGPNGALGAILPIRLKAQCLTCHGPVRSMPVEVRTELARRYPNDRAVGFSEGDLRGWFWVEVTK